jgi:hypothetical protein
MGNNRPPCSKGCPRRLDADVVADVVETMASYRPAIGIKVVLREIKKNKGLLYDSEVVDVCLKLFRQTDFQFET